MQPAGGWYPCVVDAAEFDCRDCSVGADVPCRYRSDESLRHERAARWRRFAGVAVEDLEQVNAVAEAVEAILAKQHVSMSATLLLPLLPEPLSAAVDTPQLESALRASRRFVETSPGMFRLGPFAGTVESRAGPIVDVSTGAAIDSLLSTHGTLSREDQRQKFKRLAAIRRIAEVTDGIGDPRPRLSAEIDELADSVLGEEDWSIGQAAAYAAGPEPVPAATTGDGARIAARQRLLSSMFALELLTGSTEEELVRQLRSIEEELLVRNLALVASIARKYAHGRGIDYADLFQVGSIGLMRALERFDVYRGFEFSTYATWWIRQSVTRAIADESRLIRLPVHAVDLLARVRSVRSALRQSLNREPDLTEISRAMGTDVSRLEQLLVRALPILRIDEECAEALWVEADTYTAEAEEAALRQALTEILISCIEPRERFVIERRFGLNDGEEQTLEQIGRELGVTRERIRQIEAKALKKLRSPRTLGLLRAFIDSDGPEEYSTRRTLVDRGSAARPRPEQDAQDELAESLVSAMLPAAAAGKL